MSLPLEEKLLNLTVALGDMLRKAYEWQPDPDHGEEADPAYHMLCAIEAQVSALKGVLSSKFR